MTENTRTLSIAAILILGTKCAALIGDAAPIFYLGDSEDYVRVALLSPLTDGVRSFLYGTLVRCLAGWTGSLGVLLIAQVAASIATAVLLVYVLSVLLHVRRAIAIAAGLAFAFDPLQLLLERTVLPETFTLLVFAWFSVVSLKYVLDPRPARLLWACVLGILLVALRVVYVPVAISAFAGLPALAWLRGRTVGGETGGYRRLLGHVILAGAMTLCLHIAYREVVFSLSGYSGAYQQGDGFYLASAWAPVLEPQDASEAKVAEVVEQLPVAGPDSRRELRNRNLERWLPGGLVDRLVRAFDGDEPSANVAARHLALHALRRDPLGVVRLAAQTYLGFAGIGGDVSWQLREDQGENRSFSPPIRALVRQRLGLDAGPEYQRRQTTIKRYHLAGYPWYVCLMLSPFVLAGAWWVSQPPYRPLAAFLFGECVLLLVATCFGAQEPSVRYLHPFGVGCIAGLAVVGNRFTRPRGKRNVPGVFSEFQQP